MSTYIISTHFYRYCSDMKRLGFVCCEDSGVFIRPLLGRGLSFSQIKSARAMRGGRWDIGFVKFWIHHCVRVPYTGRDWLNRSNSWPRFNWKMTLKQSNDRMSLLRILTESQFLHWLHTCVVLVRWTNPWPDQPSPKRPEDQTHSGGSLEEIIQWWFIYKTGNLQNISKQGFTIHSDTTDEWKKLK